MFPKIYREVGADEMIIMDQLLLNAVPKEVDKVADAIKAEDFAIVLTVISQYNLKRELEYKTTLVWESSPEAEKFFAYNEEDAVFTLAEDAKFYYRTDVSGGFCEYDGEYVATSQTGGRYLAQAALAIRASEYPCETTQECLQELAKTALDAFAAWLTTPGRSKYLYAIGK